MAKKFEVKKPAKGKGIIADVHQVKTITGGNLTLSSKPKSVRKGERDPEIADAKRRILNRLPTQDGQVRTLMLDGIRRAELAISKYDNRRNRKTGELRVPDKSALARDLDQVVRQTLRDARDQIIDNIERSVKTYLIGVRRSLPDRDLLKMADINRISKIKAQQIYNQPSGKSGMNTPQRLAGLGARMEKELNKLMDKGMLKRIKYKPILKRNLVDPKESNRSCVAKGISRINRTEQNKAIHAATVEVMRSLGVNFFYWRLSAAHKSYGGTEVCEVLSVSTGGDVEANLPSDFKGSLSGLYTENSLPAIPHPNCMCSLEPLFI